MRYARIVLAASAVLVLISMVYGAIAVAQEPTSMPIQTPTPMQTPTQTPTEISN